MLDRPGAPKHIVTELRVPGRSLRSLIPNSSRTSTVFQERMRTLHSNGRCSAPSIVELTAWNCGCKVVGAGCGGHQR